MFYLFQLIIQLSREMKILNKYYGVRWATRPIPDFREKIEIFDRTFNGKVAF